MKTEEQVDMAPNTAPSSSAGRKRNSLRARVDALSDWYDTHKPSVDQIVTKAAWRTVRKFAKPQHRGGEELFYRGRRIVSKPRRSSALQ